MLSIIPPPPLHKACSLEQSVWQRQALLWLGVISKLHASREAIAVASPWPLPSIPGPCSRRHPATHMRGEGGRRQGEGMLGRGQEETTAASVCHHPPQLCTPPA